MERPNTGSPKMTYEQRIRADAEVLPRTSWQEQSNTVEAQLRGERIVFSLERDGTPKFQSASSGRKLNTVEVGVLANMIRENLHTPRMAAE